MAVHADRPKKTPSLLLCPDLRRRADERCQAITEMESDAQDERRAGKQSGDVRGPVREGWFE